MRDQSGSTVSEPVTASSVFLFGRLNGALQRMFISGLGKGNPKACGSKRLKEECIVANAERLRELEEKYEGFTVYDRDGEKIGKVDDLFVDDADREEYIGVKMGLFGLSGTTLIPIEMARVDERERRIEVSDTKEHVKDAPNYSDDDEVTADFEERILRHFGMGSGQSSGGQEPYDRDADRAAGGAVGGVTAGAAPTRDDSARHDQDDDRYSGAAMGGAQNVDHTDQDRIDRDRIEQDRERDDRHSGAPMGGTEDRDRVDRDRIDQDLDRDDRYSGASTGGVDDRDRMDQGRMDQGHMDRDRIEQDRDRDDRYSEAPIGGTEDRDQMDRDRVSQ